MVINSPFKGFPLGGYPRKAKAKGKAYAKGKAKAQGKANGQGKAERKPTKAERKPTSAKSSMSQSSELGRAYPAELSLLEEKARVLAVRLEIEEQEKERARLEAARLLRVEAYLRSTISTLQLQLDMQPSHSGVVIPLSPTVVLQRATSPSEPS